MLDQYEKNTELIYSILKRKNKFYKNKINRFELWIGKKSEMNGTKRSVIQSILRQILSELLISKDLIINILSGFYNNLQDLDS
jgi:RNase P protein component